MDLPKLPIVPQWHLINGVASTSTGVFYLGLKNINYISYEDPPELKCFNARQYVRSIDVDYAWNKPTQTGLEPQKLFAIIGEDRAIQVWDLNKGYAVLGHKAHYLTEHFVEGVVSGTKNLLTMPDNELIMSFTADSKILSTDGKSWVLYCVASNTFCRIKNCPKLPKEALTTMRCSPYNKDICALGTRRGLVLICNFKNAAVLYSLRGHDGAITTLAWNMLDVTVPPASQQPPESVLEKIAEKVVTKPSTAKKHNRSMQRADATVEDLDDIFDVYDYVYLENEFGAPAQSAKHNQSDEENEFVGIEKSEQGMCDAFNFEEECQNLKTELHALKEGKQEQPSYAENAVTLADCQQANKQLGAVSNLSLEDSGDDIERIEAAAAQATATDGDSEIVSQNSARIVEDMTASALATNTENVILLASASNNAQFCIWQAETGALCDSFNAARSHAKQNNNKLSIAWLSPTRFFINNLQGGILAYSLKQSIDKTNALPQQLFKFQKDNIDMLKLPSTVANLCASRESQLLWCISYKREIFCYNLETVECSLKYACTSTNLSAMRECPGDMNKIALGFSDRRLGILDISSMSSTNINIENFTTKIESSVTALCWRADSLKLAYGTTEGRIGIIDMESAKQTPDILNAISGKPVFSICWAEDNHLYAACNHQLGIYAPNQKTAFIVQEVKNITCVMVRNEFLFVGTQNGHLNVYRRKSEENFGYELLQDINVSSRFVCDIKFGAIAQDLLAVVAKSPNVDIFKFDSKQSEPLATFQVLKIDERKCENNRIHWSNQKANELVISSNDGSVRKWRVNNDAAGDAQQLLYEKKFDSPISCALLMPSNENIIMCVGKYIGIEFCDSSVNAKDMSTELVHFRTLDKIVWANKADVAAHSNKNRNRNRRNKNKLQIAADAEINMPELELAEKLQVRDVDDLPEQLKTLQLVEMNEYDIEEEKGNMDANKMLKYQTNNACVGCKIMQNPVTLLNITSRDMNREALKKIEMMLTLNNKEESLMKLGHLGKLFNGKAMAKQLLDEELQNNKTSERQLLSDLLLTQINGSLEQEILRLIQQKKLTDWHVSVAPVISYRFWRHCAEAFANQLMEQGHALQAAIYVVTLYEKSKAIDMLLTQNYYKEALLVARVFLQPEDPQLQQIIEDWIAYLKRTGNIACASLLYLITDRKQLAFETLSVSRSAEVEKILKLWKQQIEN